MWRLTEFHERAEQENVPKFKAVTAKPLSPEFGVRLWDNKIGVLKNDIESDVGVEEGLKK